MTLISIFNLGIHLDTLLVSWGSSINLYGFFYLNKKQIEFDPPTNPYSEMDTHQMYIYFLEVIHYVLLTYYWIIKSSNFHNLLSWYFTLFCSV